MPSIKSTTQAHLDISDIKNNIVVLSNGGACAILETTAINFDLLSVQEQDAAIAAFSGLLNSLTFPIQITIRSRRMDITDYLERIKEYEEKQSNPKVRDQIRLYRSFIKDELVQREDILEKDFYVTIPYKLITLNALNPFGFVNDLLGTDTLGKSKKVNVDNVLSEAISDLAPKIQFMVKEFQRINIKSKQLNTSELIKLFYEIYNGDSARNQKIRNNDISQYTSVLVEPKLA